MKRIMTDLSATNGGDTLPRERVMQFVRNEFSECTLPIDCIERFWDSVGFRIVSMRLTTEMEMGSTVERSIFVYRPMLKIVLIGPVGQKAALKVLDEQIKETFELTSELEAKQSTWERIKRSLRQEKLIMRLQRKYLEDLPD